MRAVVIKGCCKADELTVTDIPIPKVCPGWVLIKVHAAGLNHSEAILRMYEADEDYIPTPIVPGIECAGEVADASDSNLQTGDCVVALMGGIGRSFNGSYEEYVLVPRSHVFKVNTSLSWTALAAIPETYFTAYGSLTMGLGLHKGDHLLVRGATSTVGQAAIQLAKALGATVTATSRREDSFARLSRIGADECIVDDGKLCQRAWSHRPNKLLELVGPKTLRDSLLTVSRPGYVCDTGILGNVFTIEHFEPIKYLPNGVFLSSFYSNHPTESVIHDLFQLISEHGITPLYSRVMKLKDIVEAHTLLERGDAGGKLILDLD
ncbi:MAG: zinc-binding dehydrogenase [Prevotella sp.]|nr:zinc-binding dehydrogenase [Prevotella sp.]